MASVKRKDNKGRILKTGEYQRKNGTYVYQYKDIYGKKTFVYAKTLSELRELEKDIQKDLEDRIDTKTSQRTLEEQFEVYLKTKPNLANATVVNYRCMFKKHIKDILGDKKLIDIRKSDILMLYTHLKSMGFKNGTVQLYQNLLFPTFQLAVDDNVLRTNPCINCIKDFSSNDSKENTALTDEQQENFLNFTKRNRLYARYYNLFVLFLETGCRCGEGIGLTWDDIDLENRIIDINHQLIYKEKDGKNQYYITAPKTKHGIRRIPMTEKLYHILVKHKEETFIISKKSGINIDGYECFVFLNSRQNSLLMPNTINSVIKKLILQYNSLHNDDPLPKFTIHSFRHTACTRMAKRGMDMKVLQYILGHANIQITMNIYNHISEKRVVEEMQKLDCLFNDL